MIKQRKLIIDFLMQNFRYSMDTAVKWLNAANWNFGGATPEELIQADSYDKVMLFLVSVKQGY